MYELEKINLKRCSEYVVHVLRPSYLKGFMTTYLNTVDVEMILSQESVSVTKAAQVFLDQLCLLEEDGWFQAFLDVLQAEDYIGLYDSLTKWDFQALESTRPHRVLLDRIEPSFTKKIKARDLLLHLGDCLHPRECEEIQAAGVTCLFNTTSTPAAGVEVSSAQEQVTEGQKDKKAEKKLREYQRELAEPVFQGQNTLICAPTGCGKTVVALAICEQHLKVKGKAAKIVFMATKVDVYEQQYKLFKEHFQLKDPDVRIEGLCGNQADTLSMTVILENNDIIILTPQILVNALSQGEVSSLSCFSLLILDECHNTTGKHPYNIIMSSYMDAKLRPQEDHQLLPQIVGLTASVGIGSFKNQSDAESNICQLCGSLDTRVISTVQTHKDELSSFVYTPEKEFFLVKRRQTDPFIRIIHDIMGKIEGLAKKVHDIDSLSSIVNRDYGSQKYEQWIVDVQKKCRVLQLKDQHEEKHSLTICQYAGDRIHHTILALCEDTGSDNESQNESEPDDFNPQSPEPPRPVSPDSADSNDISQCLAEGSVQQSCPAPPGPDDISQSRADGPVQPVLKVFPKTQHGSRKRAFIETWYKDFTWLEYSVSRDSKYNDALIINEDARTKDALQFLIEFIEQVKNAGHDDTERQLTAFFDVQKGVLLNLATGGQTENPKLEDLQYILEEQYRQKDETKSVLFVRTRALADALKKWIEETDSLKFLKPGVLIGRGRKSTHLTTGMTQTSKRGVLDSFKSEDNQTKILIATSVADEGIDIPQCNLVLMYEYVGNVVKMVQVRGRGRAQGSMCILISDKKETIDKEKHNMEKEKLVEKAIKNLQAAPADMLQKIDSFQRRDKMYRDIEKHGAERPRVEGNYELLCSKCKIHGCYTEHIRVMQESHHIVVDSSFFSRARTEPHPKPKGSYLVKTKKLFCKQCGLDWGIVASFQTIQDLPVIKIDAFVVKNSVSKQQRYYRKWRDVDFTIKTFDLSEITHSLMPMPEEQ
ncbi:hypothetical protein UPYG_G00243720 [Umbra pygmaea]|uniref:Activating signal cointegrator 1 complex subunit 3 n=1 Tax=Umbra pygmaea TaxID=75934 RepID=A0ABD0X216_UMBPY